MFVCSCMKTLVTIIFFTRNLYLMVCSASNVCYRKNEVLIVFTNITCLNFIRPAGILDPYCSSYY